MPVSASEAAYVDAAFGQAVERGYNTVRICAMPYLLFGDHGIDFKDLHSSESSLEDIFVDLVRGQERAA